MVPVGRTGQEHGEYEVVGHLPDYRMTCFRKLSDEIRLSSSQYSLVFSRRKFEFSLSVPSLPFGGPFCIFLISMSW